MRHRLVEWWHNFLLRLASEGWNGPSTPESRPLVLDLVPLHFYSKVKFQVSFCVCLPPSGDWTIGYWLVTIGYCFSPPSSPGACLATCFARPQCAFFLEKTNNMSHLAWLISLSVSLVLLGDDLNLDVCVFLLLSFNLLKPATITGLTGPVYAWRLAL